MSLTSASTRADAVAQYNDNLGWEGSPAKAALALEAIRWLLVNRPTRFSQNDRTSDYESLLDEKQKLEEYVILYGTAQAGQGFRITAIKSTSPR